MDAPDLTLMLLAAGLGGVLILIIALQLILSGEDRIERRRRDRIRALARRSAEAEVSALIARRAPEGLAARLPFVGDLGGRLNQAGLMIGPLRFCLMAAGAGAVAAPLALMAGGPVAALGAATMFGLLLPVALVNLMRRRRIDALTRQLPDALDLMARGLKVGHPVSATMANVARTMPDPIGVEFRIMVEQIQHGDYLTKAFSDMARRMDQEDVDYLAVSISIQHGTGGNLGDMLGVLSRVIRDRMMMRRKVVAISSEGRLSAGLLSALPVGIYIVTSLTSPEYYGGVRDDPMFMPIAATILVLLLANALALRKLVKFDI